MPNSFLAHAWASSPERLAIAAAVTLGFAVLARILRGVNRSGAMAGGLSCFLLFAGAGPTAFAMLAALFVMTWISTRMGYRRKLALGIAERREGRNAWQVLANLSVAALGSVVFSATGNRFGCCRRSLLWPRRRPTPWPAKSVNTAAGGTLDHHLGTRSRRHRRRHHALRKRRRLGGRVW